MKYCLVLLLLLAPASAFGQTEARQPASAPLAGPDYSDSITVFIGLTDDGAAARLWLEALEKRISAAELEKIRTTKKAMTPPEAKWAKMIAETAFRWSAQRKRLHIPFGGKVKTPDEMTILVGNQGGTDGFTLRDNVICSDLSALVAAYGDADLPGNQARWFRILDHEYTHLLHHRWLERHSVELDTPWQRAQRDLIVEGLGNYRSLTDKWVSEKGELTELAKATLKKLEPVFVERLTKLRVAEAKDEEELRRGLSQAAFDKKWGALCMALWLAQEAGGDDRNLVKWVERGPEGIVELADKYLPAELKAKFLK